MRYGFFFDQSKCSGCGTCIVACKDFHMIKPGKGQLRKNRAVETGKFMDGSYKKFNMVYSCNHCEDPKCVPACPVGAVQKEAGTNIVKINRTACQGWGECIAQCPYNSPDLPEDRQEPVTLSRKTPTKGHRAFKCDMCAERREKGQQPACVSACLMRAIEWGPYDDLAAKHGTNSMATGFPITDTKPSIIIKQKS